MASFSECELQNKGLLTVRDINETTTFFEGCVETGTPESPSIIQLPVLPHGDYIAELIEPRTQKQLNDGEDTGFVSVAEFTVCPLPVVQYEISSGHKVINGVGQWTHTVTYYISGNVITELTHEEGAEITLIGGTDSVFAKDYTNGTYSPKFRIHEPVRLSGVQFADQFLDCFTPIDADTGLGTVVPCALCSECSNQLTLQDPDAPVLQSRVCDGRRELDHDILHDPVSNISYLFIDTRQSVGDRLEVSINGAIETHETFGVLKIPIGNNGIDIIVAALLTVGGVVLRDEIALSGVVPEAEGDMDAIHGLRIKKHDTPVPAPNVLAALGAEIQQLEQGIAGITEQKEEALAQDPLADVSGYDTQIAEKQQTLQDKRGALQKEVARKPKVSDINGYVEYYSRTLREAVPQSPQDATGKSSFWDSGWGRFPFNRIKPCWVNKEGFVEVYFKPDDYTKIESDASERRIGELQRQIDSDTAELQQVYAERQGILDRDPTADVSAWDNQILVLTEALAEHTAEMDAERRSALASRKVEYIDDPLGRIRCVDGHVMIEFQNIYYTVFDDDEWVYIRISDRKKYCWWRSTHTKTDGGINTEFDTIYISPFYAYDYRQDVDGSVFPHSNPTYIETNYTGNPSSVAKVRGIGSHFDVFDIQNAALLKLLQVFRFKSTDDFEVSIGFTGDTSTVPKLVNVPMFAVKDGKKFAGLDYPFGFGATIQSIDAKTNADRNWEYTKVVEGFSGDNVGTLFVPSVYGAYYGKLGGQIATLSATTDYTTHLLDYSSVPSGYQIRDRLPIDIVAEVSDATVTGGQKRMGYIGDYQSYFGWNKPHDVLLELEGADTDGFTLPLIVTPVSGSFTEQKSGTDTVLQSKFKASYGHLSSQIVGGFTRRDTARAYPSWSYTLLNRAVFWRPNERHDIDVRYKTLLYALPQDSGVLSRYAKFAIESYSYGWKQTVSINDSTYEQNRVKKNVPDADFLRWSGMFNLPLGEYQISSKMYNTNGIVVAEETNTLRVIVPPISLSKKSIYTPNTVGLVLYKDIVGSEGATVRKHLAYDTLDVSFLVKQDNGTVVNTGTITYTSLDVIDGVLQVAPTETCTIRVNVVGEASPDGIVVDFPVLVDENYIDILPFVDAPQPADYVGPVTAETAHLPPNQQVRPVYHVNDRFIKAVKSNSSWTIYCYYDAAVKFKTVEIAGGSTEFLYTTQPDTDQTLDIDGNPIVGVDGTPIGGVGHILSRPLPNVGDPGNYDTTSEHPRKYEILNQNGFEWSLPYGFGNAYRMQFISNVPFLQHDAEVTVTVYAIDPWNMSVSAFPLVRYRYTYTKDGLLSIWLQDDDGHSLGGKFTITYDDGGRVDGEIVFDAESFEYKYEITNTDGQKVTRSFDEPIYHKYSEVGEYIVTITIWGKGHEFMGEHDTAMFVSSDMSPIYTVRIDETKNYKILPEGFVPGTTAALEYRDGAVDIQWKPKADAPENSIVRGPKAFDHLYPFTGVQCVLMDGLNMLRILDKGQISRDEYGTYLTAQELMDYDTLVEIPRFYYKISKTGSYVDVSICAIKIDDTWTCSTANGNDAMYIASFLASPNKKETSGEDVGWVESVSRQGGAIDARREIDGETPIELEESFYDLLDYKTLTALQCLFLVRYAVIDSTAVWEGDNPPTIAGRANLVGGKMNADAGVHCRFYGVDNFWGFRPTLLAGIESTETAVSITSDGETVSYPVQVNTDVANPIITKTVGDSHAGFLPVEWAGFPGEHYHDPVRWTGDERVFFGSNRECSEGYGSNGIFAIGNRVKQTDVNGIEQYVTPYVIRKKIKDGFVEAVKSIGFLQGTMMSFPQKAVFIDQPNNTLRVELYNNRAGKYKFRDDMGSNFEIQYDPKVSPTVLEQQYTKGMEVNPNVQEKNHVKIYALDNTNTVQHVYETGIFVLNLSAVIFGANNGSDIPIWVYDPIVIDASLLSTLQLGTHITIDWGVREILKDANGRPIRDENGYVQLGKQVITEADVGDVWRFTFWYKEYYDRDSTIAPELTITVDGGQWSNGGTVRSRVRLLDAAYSYTFPTIAGYANTRLADGTIDDNDGRGFVMTGQFDDSACEKMIFYSDHSLLLDKRFRQDMIERNVLTEEIVDWMIRCDAPVHVQGPDENHVEIYPKGGFDIKYSYMKPGVYYPKFELWGFERTFYGTMRIVVLNWDEVLPKVELVDGEVKHAGETNDPDGYATAICDLTFDESNPNARTIKIDWGDGTFIWFNPAARGLQVAPNRSASRIVISHEVISDNSTANTADITIKTTDNNGVIDEQTHRYEFATDTGTAWSSEFFDWIGSNFTNVQSLLQNSGRAISDAINDSTIYCDGYIDIRAAIPGHTIIDITVDWANVPDVIVFNGHDINRHEIYDVLEGHNGVRARNVTWPPTHHYRWAGIFEITITAYGDKCLEDTKKYSFDSYPVYGGILPDKTGTNFGGNRVSYTYAGRKINQHKLENIQNTGINPWDDVWMFSKIRPVLFSSWKQEGNAVTQGEQSAKDAGKLGVLKELSKLTVYKDKDGNDTTFDVAGLYITNTMNNQTTREWIDITDRDIADYLTAHSEYATEDDIPPSEMRALLNAAYDKAMTYASTLTFSTHDPETGEHNPDWRGDVFVEIPNMYFNLHREKMSPFPFYRDMYTNVTNSGYSTLWDCLFFEVCDRRLEPHWEPTAIFGHQTQSHFYISRYHAQNTVTWGGVHSLAMQRYYQEDYEGQIRAAREAKYDLMHWHHATALQLLGLLRFGNTTFGGNPSATYSDTGQNNMMPIWRDYTEGNVIGEVSTSGGGSYNFAGISEPASTYKGSWIVSNNKQTGLEITDIFNVQDPSDPSKIVNGNGWAIINHDYPVSRPNYSRYLPMQYYDADTDRIQVVNPRSLVGHYRDDHPLVTELRNKGINVPSGLDNSWGLFPVASILEQPNVRKYIKWGTGAGVDFFSGWNVSVTGGITETTSGASVNLALLTYNNTRAIDDAVVNYRTFVYEATPVRQWVDTASTAAVLFRAVNPQNFLHTDKVQFITADGDTVFTVPVTDATDLETVEAGVTHEYTLPGRYMTQCLVLDKNDARSNLGHMSNYTIPIEIFGVNVQVLYATCFAGETIEFYCQLSYGEKISFDPQNGDIQHLNADLVQFQNDYAAKLQEINDADGEIVQLESGLANIMEQINTALASNPNADVSALRSQYEQKQLERLTKVNERRVLVNERDALQGQVQQTSNKLNGFVKEADVTVTDDATTNWFWVYKYEDPGDFTARFSVEALGQSRDQTIDVHIMPVIAILDWFSLTNSVNGDGEVKVMTPVQFHFENSQGSRMVLYPDYDNNPDIYFETTAQPYRYVYEYPTLGTKHAVLQVYGGSNYVEHDAYIEVYADAPVADLVVIGQDYCDQSPVRFSFAGASDYVDFTVYYKNLATNVVTPGFRWATSNQPQNKQFSLPLLAGSYEAWMESIGFFGTDASVSTPVSFTVTAASVNLQANLPGEQPSASITAMIPVTVEFAAPNTSCADQVYFRYATNPTADAVIDRTPSPANFEHTYTYTEPGVYEAIARIVVNDNGDVLWSNRVTINAELPAINRMTLLEAGYVPKTVSITVETNAGQITIDWDADADDNAANPWDYGSGTKLGIVDTVSPHVDIINVVNGSVTVTHTYTVAGAYTVRVCTGTNSTRYDRQYDTRITMLEVTNNSGGQFDRWPPSTIRIDMSTSRGAWAEVIPGDCRTYDFGTMTLEERTAEIRTLYARGVKIVQLDCDGDGIPETQDVIVYFKNALQMPWVFDIPYEQAGQWQADTIVYSERPFYDELDE